MMKSGLTQSVSRGKFFYEWFVGREGEDKLKKLGWGRDLGKPERAFFSVNEVSPETLEKGYSDLEKKGRPIYQSISYYMGRDDSRLVSGRIAALEKIFIDLDVKGVDVDRAIRLALEEARILYDHLRSFGEPLMVFSGRRGYHIYLWLPAAIEDKDVYTYIIKALGIHELGLRFIDTVVLEPCHIARIPYTLHEKTGKQVTPLDSDFRPIDIESFSLHSYFTNPMDNHVIEEAYTLKEAYSRLELARKYWMYLELLKNPRKALVSNKLPDIVRWLLDKGAEEGYRNNAAFIIATWLMNKGYTYDDTLLTLQEWNEKNKPPLPQREIEYVVRSVFKHRYKPVSRKKAIQWIKGDGPYGFLE